MKPRVGIIDSLNFSSKILESYFDNGDYNIQVVKSVSVFEPILWREAFKKALTRNIIEAKILHTTTGLMLPMKRFSTSKDKQTVEFAGVHGYNEKSSLLNELLKELMPKVQDEVITRLDVAIDFKSKIPSNVIKKLCASRVPFSWCNSEYLKTKSEKKTNAHINILLYPKHIKENLDYELERLEFSFRGAYLRGQYQVKDIPKAYEKMQKTIKRFTGLEVVINPL